MVQIMQIISYKHSKLKLWVFLAGNIIAMVTCYAKIDDCNLFSNDWEFA